MNVETRQKVERQMARKFAKIFLAAGMCISVQDGEEWVLSKSTSLKDIIAAMFSTDEDRLRVWQKDDTGAWKHLGTALFVYGNDGWDVLADYHVTLEPWLAPLHELADKLEQRYC
jgi:hypothetical protein